MNKYKYPINKKNCAPCNKNSNSKLSCYSDHSLNIILNNINSDINVNKLRKRQKWDMIQKYFHKNCNKKESCWKNQNIIKNLKNKEINNFTFKPDFPESWKKDKYTWLNTYDILNVMKQYEKKNKDFLFLGPIPSDCPQEITCELSNLDLIKLKKNKIYKIGIIYNLDKSTGSGTHWTGIYIDNKNNEINYYDSYGSLPTNLISNFIKKISENYIKNNYKTRLLYNDKRHQYGGSECGMYSMNFILERLHGNTMYDISTRKISDESMNNLRKILYNSKY